MKNKVGDANSDRRYESADRNPLHPRVSPIPIGDFLTANCHELIPLGESDAPGVWAICGYRFLLLPEDEPGKSTPPSGHEGTVPD
ncbi:hypothetical protein SAMN05444280_1184 [Tangfeifania diversioriginum]|uniref:Uncharacterized protein n=1 Tax=Tangfeifania diversioriginum TaxID=1168035 RepID=A0A1M6IVK3_9BACT|nr:hypothetical protein [Tangfeifania diversioriginum]SHJ38404.1 hypothetical protein SAMN05444280_1184 [Tangfeifania diversioriginum]